MLSDDTRYRLLKFLEQNPTSSQRALARELGISLGKVNYCLKALIDKGFVKATNFKQSSAKTAYAYLLTPQGMEEKAATTIRFLKSKLEEHRRLQEEIEELRKEAAAISDGEPNRSGSQKEIDQ